MKSNKMINKNIIIIIHKIVKGSRGSSGLSQLRQQNSSRMARAAVTMIHSSQLKLPNYETVANRWLVRNALPRLKQPTSNITAALTNYMNNTTTLHRQHCSNPGHKQQCTCNKKTCGRD